MDYRTQLRANPQKTVVAQLDEALTLHQRLPRAERLARIHDITRAVGLNEHVLQLSRRTLRRHGPA